MLNSSVISATGPGDFPRSCRLVFHACNNCERLAACCSATCIREVVKFKEPGVQQPTVRSGHVDDESDVNGGKLS